MIARSVARAQRRSTNATNPVRVVATGQALLAPAITRRLIHEFAHQRPRADTPAPTTLAALTPREIEVLRLIAEGAVEPRDCAPPRRHRTDGQGPRQPATPKLGLRDRSQTVIAGYETGLINPRQPISGR